MRLHVNGYFWTFPLLSGSLRDYSIQRWLFCPRGKHRYREVYYPKKGRHFEACTGCRRIGKVWRWAVPDDGDPQASSFTKQLIERARETNDVTEVNEQTGESIE